ncbi:mitochondrial inner-membrane-bound regulator-domain-containing protein [Cercophora scortea]|uniref:Mitochondrial inner-membrane-bound regulator-domain-containing protein n=1 Tax=Cercophora scortea TaxID=314031 RepID=A0AAE0J4Q9_9PEZI|nr:mitochondrial inner-membrane-bound regulator-domain-containing protein [Cercophora scortea]
MLGRKVSSSFICLRCRLQLAGSSTPRRRPSSSFFASSLLAASPAARHNTIISSGTGTGTGNRRQYATNGAHGRDAPAPDDAELGQETREGRDSPGDSNEISEKRKAWTVGFEPSITTTSTSTTTDNVVTGSGTGAITISRDIDSYSRQLDETSQDPESPHQPPRVYLRAYHFNGERLVYRDRPQRQFYNSRGQRLSPEGRHLDIDILGSPGSALVMRDCGEFKTRGEDMDILSPDTTSNKPVDVNKLLENELALPDADEVIANIHELRPTDSNVLSEDDFAALQQTLVKGFTKAQLESYVTYHHSLRELLEDIQVSTDTPWVLERRPWMLALHEGEVMIDSVLHGYVDLRTSPKAKAALWIMRECWDLDCKEVVDRPGFLDIKLRDTEFTVLTLGERRFLGNIADKFLGKGKEIMVRRQSNTLSILAPKETTEKVLEAINVRIRNIREVAFPVSLVSDKPIEPALLAAAQRLTNAFVRLDPTGNEVVVTWINIPSRPEHFENTGEIVLRFLHALTHTPRTSSTVKVMLAEASAESETMGHFVVMYGCEPRLPWHERHKRWARFVTALPPVDSVAATTKPNTPTIPIPTSILPHPVDIRPRSEPTPGDIRLVDTSSPSDVPNPQGWSSSLATDTTAIYGHVLHESPPSTSPSTQLTRYDESASRTFNSVLPPLYSLAMDTNLHETGLWHMTLVLRFLPSPYLPPDLLSRAPTLELRIDADYRELKHMDSLRAIVSTHRADVLFPAAPVDVRMTQTRYFSLPGTAIDLHATPLLEFLRVSDLRPWDGNLTTPNVLNGIRLPRRMLAPSPDSDGEEQQAGDDKDDLVEIDYIFASLETERTVTAEYDGFKLGYRSIEAGKRGGKRSEVFLDPELVPDPRVEPDETGKKAPHPVRSVEEYMATVQKLARETRTFLWHAHERRVLVDY